MADVVYLVQDMMFTSKIREVAKQIGVSVQGVRDPAALAGAMSGGAKLVILDLRLRRPAMRCAAGRGPGDARHTVGRLIDHEKTDVMDAARAQGCGQVMAKGNRERATPSCSAASLRPRPAIAGGQLQIGSSSRSERTR